MKPRLDIEVELVLFIGRAADNEPHIEVIADIVDPVVMVAFHSAAGLGPGGVGASCRSCGFVVFGVDSASRRGVSRPTSRVAVAETESGPSPMDLS